MSKGKSWTIQKNLGDKWDMGKRSNELAIRVPEEKKRGIEKKQYFDFLRLIKDNTVQIQEVLRNSGKAS